MRPSPAAFVHPVLLTSYAILALAAANVRELPLAQATRSWIIGSVVAIVLVLAARLIFVDWHKAGVFASVLLLWFFAYGHVYATLERVVVAGEILGRHRYLVPASVLLIILTAVWLARRRNPLDHTTRLLNGLALVLLAFPVLTIGRYWLQLSREGELHPLTLAPSSELYPAEGMPTPDIYYIILDGYARSDVMRETFGYDNSDFLLELERRGFYIAENGHANFFRTAYSLASSLNMEFVQNLGVSLERGSYPTPFFGPIRRSLVRLQLEELGYTTVALRSGFAPTEWIDADYYLAPDPVDLEALQERPSLNAFEGLLMHTSGASIVRDLGLDLAGAREGTARPGYPFELLRLIILAAFDNLEAAPSLPGPKFVFAHIVAPHRPYLFGTQGEPLSPSGPFTLAETPARAGLSETAQMYAAQATFISTKVLQTVERILERSATPPVIIIQADHGYGDNWETMDSPGASQRAAILNAYYLPHGCDRYLYPSITPVNTFRVVFNCYFSASYPLLEDVVYYSYPPWVDGTGFVPLNERLQAVP